MRRTGLAFAAGLPPVGRHGLLHGWATYALLAGVDIVLVQEQPGYASSEITRDTYPTVLSELSGRSPRRSRRWSPGSPRDRDGRHARGYPSDTRQGRALVS